MAPLHSTYHHEDNEDETACCNFLLRLVTSIILGLLAAYMMNAVLIEPAKLNPTTTQILGLASTVFITVGCTIFKNIRCMALLVAVGGCGWMLRASAVSSLAIDLTEAIDDLFTVPDGFSASPVRRALHRVPPLQSAMESLRVDNAEILAALKMGVDIIKPLEAEFTSFSEFSDVMTTEFSDLRLHSIMITLMERVNGFQREYDRVHKDDTSYHTKLLLRAFRGLNKAKETCIQDVAVMQEICRQSLFLDDICQSFQQEFICNITKGINELAYETDFGVPGAVHAGLTALIKSLMPDDSSVKPISPIPTRKLYSAKSEGKIRTGWLEWFVNFISVPIYLVARLTPLSVLFSVFRAERYRERYLKDMNFDNHYITDYFYKIDKERKKAGKESLLPLNKMEENQLVNKSKISFSNADIVRIIRNEAMVAGEILAAISLWFMGCLVVNAIAEHPIEAAEARAPNSYSDDLNSPYKMTIQGDGIVATISQFLTDSYVQSATAYLLPDLGESAIFSGEIPEFGSQSKPWVMYGLVAILTLVDGLVRRLPSIICSFFYPETEKQRINFLYQTTLADRKRFNQDKDRKLIKAAFQNKNTLKMAKWMGAQCTCCRGKKDLVLCNDCHLWYCSDCWPDWCCVCEAETVAVHPWDD